jgi:hypothetical protein
VFAALLAHSLVRMVLQYVTAAMPKYLNRVFGPKCGLSLHAATCKCTTKKALMRFAGA